MLCIFQPRIEELSTQERRKSINFQGFVDFCYDLRESSPSILVRAIESCGFDMHLNKSAPLRIKEWVKVVNGFQNDFDVELNRLDPIEIYDVNGEQVAFTELHRKVEHLKKFNERFKSELIQILPENLVAIFKEDIFESVKREIMWDLLNSSTKEDHADDVEIELDPVQQIDGQSSWFLSAMTQIMSNGENSVKLWVPLARGGDPRFPFLVRLKGEHVQGTSGSFRDFMSRIANELQTYLDLFFSYTGSDSLYKGFYHLKTGFNISPKEGNMLKFLGLIFGVALRSGIPFPLRLMPTFWQSLLGEEISTSAIDQYDNDTKLFIEKLNDMNAENEEQFLENLNYPKFGYNTLNGIEVNLGDDRHAYLKLSNRTEFVREVQALRIKEFTNEERMNHIRDGLKSVIPFNSVASIFTSVELEKSVCGTDRVDIASLKRRTIYQAGLTENDDHIRMFWRVLESFTERELKKFVKFACNQERLPRDENSPPFPMKLAPTDDGRQDEVAQEDKKLVRAETCIFLVKLPIYSTFNVMKEKLLYVLDCAYDPLVG